MKTLFFISISIFYLKIPSILTNGTPRQILERNCPCFPLKACLVTKLDERLEKKLPSCPSNQRRCCSKGDVLAAVSEVIKLNGLKAAQIRLPSVECVAISVCEVTYGSLTSHFDDFGFINPLDRNCLAKDGMVLCILDPNSPLPARGTLTATTAPYLGQENRQVTRKPLPISDMEPVMDYEQEMASQVFFAAPNDQPVRQTRLLPCVPLHVCEEVFDFGEEEHLDRYGPQHECYEFQSVRCVQLDSSVLPQPSNDPIFFPDPSQSSKEPTIPHPSMLLEHSKEPTSLPCVPDEACRLVYEANESHIAQFGHQDQCEHFDWVRCLLIDVSLFPQPDATLNSSDIVDMLSPTNTDPDHISLPTNTDPDYPPSPTDQYQLHLPSSIGPNDLPFFMNTIPQSGDLSSRIVMDPDHFPLSNNTDQHQFHLPSSIDSNDLPVPLNNVPHQGDLLSETNTDPDYSPLSTNTDQDQFHLPSSMDSNDLPFSLNVSHHGDIPSESNTDPDNHSLPSNSDQYQLHLPSSMGPNDEYQLHLPNDGNSNDLPFSLNVSHQGDLSSETNTDPDHLSLPSNTDQYQLHLPSSIDPNDEYQVHLPNDGNLNDLPFSTNIDPDHPPLPTNPTSLALPNNTDLSRNHSPSNPDPIYLPCVPEDNCGQIYDETNPQSCHQDDQKTITHITYVRCVQVKPSQQDLFAAPAPLFSPITQQVPGVTIFSTQPIYITNGSLFGGRPSVQGDQDQLDEDQKGQISLLLGKIISRLDNLVKKRNDGAQTHNLV